MPVARAKIKGPFHGIMTDVPPCFDDQGFDDLVNIMGWKGRMRTRPALNLNSSFAPPNGEIPLNMTSFTDAEGFLHTLLLTDRNAYMLTAGLNLNLLSYPQFIKSATLNSTGAGGYTEEDVLTIIQGSASGGTILVTSVDGSGNILTYTLNSPGTGYVTGTALATSGGTGTSATFDIVGGTISSLAGTGLPYGVVKANSRVYFSNGSAPLMYCDGEAILKIAGNVPGACRYLTANKNHMIGAFWTEPDPSQPGSTLFRNRVRWSDVGNFDQWDTVDPQFTSGVDDLIDTPDIITGLSTIGNNSYIYRTNGISSMVATGQASIPFIISDFSLAPKGEGSPYPYSLATYNNVDRFIGNYDVYSFDGTNFQPLMDGKCNAKFFADLAKATGMLQVRGFITTVLDNGFPYLGYVITIPGANVSWVLNITEGSWTKFAWNTPAGKHNGYFDLQFIEQVYVS